MKNKIIFLGIFFYFLFYVVFCIIFDTNNWYGYFLHFLFFVFLIQIFIGIFKNKNRLIGTLMIVFFSCYILIYNFSIQNNIADFEKKEIVLFDFNCQNNCTQDNEREFLENIGKSETLTSKNISDLYILLESEEKYRDFTFNKEDIFKKYLSYLFSREDSFIYKNGNDLFFQESNFYNYFSLYLFDNYDVLFLNGERNKLDTYIYNHNFLTIFLSKKNLYNFFLPPHKEIEKVYLKLEKIESLLSQD